MAKHWSVNPRSKPNPAPVRLHHTHGMAQWLNHAGFKPPYAENRMSGGWYGHVASITVTRPDHKYNLFLADVAARRP